VIPPLHDTPLQVMFAPQVVFIWQVALFVHVA